MGNKLHKSLPPPPPDKCDQISLPSLTPVTHTSSTESLPDGITLIWLDEYAGKSCSEDAKTTLSYLRQLNVACIRLCNDVNSCLTFIKSISNDENNRCSKLFLILSGAFSSIMLPELKSFPIINSVFIFCFQRSNYTHLIDEYKPILINICTENTELYNCINQQIEELNQLTLVFHFFSQEQNTTRNLTKDAASFLWFQLFQLMISELKCTQNEKYLMLDYCSKQLQNDPKQKRMLSHIEQFHQDYTTKDAIRWYTKESFVYRLLNTALRTEDIEALYIFRFFIVDLCQQLKLEHKKLREKQNQSPILTLYRGGHISRKELDNLQGTVGKLTSLNGFISTSMERWVAMQFIQKQQSRQKNAEKVLFIIQVDIRSEHIICANIREMSVQQEEEEVLFNMGTVFHLDNIEFDSIEQIHNVYMRATEDGIKAAKDYIQLIRKELTDTSVEIIFGQLFLQMGNYPMAQKYFLELLKHSKQNDRNFADIVYHLALTDGYQGNLHDAEDRLKQVFQCHISLNSKDLDLARTKNALGWIYHHSGELDEAMTYYQEALAFAEDRIGLKHLINAQTCSFLGDCYLEKYQFDQAKMYYEQALEIENLCLPANHPRIGVTHNDLGNVFRKQKDMKKALEYYEQAEAIFHQSLPSHHPSTAYCWSCMAFIYLYEGQIAKAQEYHEKALQTYQRVLPADHINIKISEKNSKCTDFQKINDTYVKICAQV